jgi:hypothetical protein
VIERRGATTSVYQCVRKLPLSVRMMSVRKTTFCAVSNTKASENGGKNGNGAE